MSVPQQLVEVSVEQGILRGERVPAQDGRPPYDAFRGIPYAEKPVGSLRFKAPRPPRPWEGVRPALEEGPIAPQLRSGGQMVGNEDCLYLNVYTPQVPASKAIPSQTQAGPPWPIMFWLHPGGFAGGSGSPKEYGPELLVAKNVVVVTINYRLAAFGFLSLRSSAATGNYGLKDQLAALRWVKKNGSAFGGDVNQITLFGSSAGAASIQYFQLSPLPKGLFQRAISTSGSCLNPAMVTRNPRERALRLARQLGASEDDLQDDEQTLRFLRHQPAEAILKATVEIAIPEDLTFGTIFMFQPTSEQGLKPDDSEDEVFLPGFSEELVKQGRITQVPLMMGVMEQELFFADLTTCADAIKAVPEVFAKYDRQLELILPPELKPVNPDGSEKLKETVRRIRNLYFDGGSICEATRDGYYKMQADAHIINGCVQEARMCARESDLPVYFFCFTVRGRINRLSSRSKLKYDETPGATHGDELSYLWTSPADPKLEPESLEAKTRHRLVTLWTNFAKYGNPTPEGEKTLGGVRWPTVPRDVTSSVPYLKIGADLKVPNDGFNQERVQLWDSFYSELQ